MMSEPNTLRAGISSRHPCLADEWLDLAERARQTQAPLHAALDTTAALTPGVRAALDANPDVQVALARLAASDEVYLLAGPDPGP